MNNDFDKNSEYEENSLNTENSENLENKEESSVSLYDKSNYYYSGDDEQEGKGEESTYSAPIQEIDNGNNKTLLWSVLSLIFGIASVICCCFLGGGIVLAVVSIIFSFVARKKLGYFDGLAIAGLILGIFGIVFGISAIIFTMLGGVTPDIDFDVDNYTNIDGGI